MKKTLVLLLAAAAVMIGAVALDNFGGARADSTATTTPVAGPATGFTLHIDAVKHFPNHPDEVAHHWCKTVEGLSECQIYDSDGPLARLVEIEMIIPTDVWKTLPPDEQKLWHYHKLEIPKVGAKLPGMSADEAAKVMASMQETYGKVYQLWDPMTSKIPVGQPQVNILN
jgi:Protein of unknown function (DUF1264)